LSYCDEDIYIGDLVCLKTDHFCNDGWVSADVDAGIIIEIIEVTTEFSFYDKKLRCYDYVICWSSTGRIEAIPDILVEKFIDRMRRLDEKRLC